MKKAIKWIIAIPGIVVILFAFVLLFFTLTAYQPPAEEKIVNLSETQIDEKHPPEEVEILSWNMGYAGLDKNADFILEGGKMGVPKEEKIVRNNLEAIKKVLKKYEADVYFIQEVDTASSRSFYIDQRMEIIKAFGNYKSWYATNYKALFVPSPLKDPIGRVHSGILTLSKWGPDSALRLQLPGDYSWPVRVFHLKRCLSVTHFQSATPDKAWYFINLHLSAYDAGGTLRKQQLDFTKKLMLDLYNQGHYVVLGGDWNSLFPGVARDKFDPHTTQEQHLYWIQKIDKNWTPANWTWAYDIKTPTCRTLEKPYKEYENYRSVIDGFLLSPNVTLMSVKGINLGFEHSDHNPVLLKVKQKQQK